MGEKNDEPTDEAPEKRAGTNVETRLKNQPTPPPRERGERRTGHDVETRSSGEKTEESAPPPGRRDESRR